MALRIATLISSGSSTNNTTSTGAVTKDRLCGGLPKRWLQPIEIIACALRMGWSLLHDSSAVAGDGSRNTQRKPTENLRRPHKQEDDADAIEIDEIYFGSGKIKQVLHTVSKVPIPHSIQRRENVDHFLTQ